jgi:UDP-N-acetylmuramoyl-tripeptide--D-alanyl-D-alanine ligase
MIDSLASAAASMSGVLNGADGPFSGVSTDTRTIQRGQLFFALQGPNFDGHNYVGRALAGGGAAAVVDSHVDQEIAQIIVDDARRALGRFGKAWRNDKNVRVVAITGSNGKTTLKELVAAILRSAAPTLATKGNLNNDIGMPLMLTQLDDEHEFAVLELGANHAGEIAYLASLLRAEVVAISNAGAAHLEGFGSIEGVAHAKGELLQTADRPRVAVLNADDDYFEYWSGLAADIEIVSFGFSAAADVRATNIVANASHSDFDLHVAGEATPISLPMPGLHNVRNACAAAAITTAMGIDVATIKAALQNVEPVDGRLFPLAGVNGCALFDDSYNANPLSVRAAADFIASLPGESWLVLGDMNELGEGATRMHREVGASARASGVSRLFAIGDLTKHSVDGFGDGACWYASIDALLGALVDVEPTVNVLVKGSRSMRMERIVAALRDDAALRREA